MLNLPEKGDLQWENTIWLIEESYKLSHTNETWKLAEDGTKINEDEKKSIRKSNLFYLLAGSDLVSRVSLTLLQLFSWICCLGVTKGIEKLITL